jgi:hypothetical protein
MEMGDGCGLGRSENSPNVEGAADVVEQGFDSGSWRCWGVRLLNVMAGKELNGNFGWVAAAGAVISQ